MFVRAPKNMRKEKIIWKLLKVMYGTQVASSRWQRLVRETLCDGHGKFSQACRLLHTIGKKTHWCCFTETMSWQKVTTAHWTKWMKCWVRSRSSACRALVLQLVVGVSFYTEGYGGTNLGSSYRPDPKHVDAFVDTLSLEDGKTCWQDHSHVTLDRVKPTLCAR